MATVHSDIHEASYFGRMVRLRYFLISLVSMDLRSRYKRSYLGMGWSLVRPIAMTTVLCLIFCKIFNLELSEYAPFLLSGLTVWQLFVEAATLGCFSFLQNASYIRQQPIPMAIFPLRVVLGSVFHSLIAMTLVVALAAYFRGPHILAGLIYLPPVLVLLMILCWSVATICGLLHAHFPDTQHLLEIMLQILFYLTPIIYPLETIRARERFAALLNLNPLTHVVEIVRQPLTQGAMPPLTSLAVAATLTLILFGLASVALRKSERTLVFWL